MRWADRDALLKHFAVPASRELVQSPQTLAAGPTTLELFDASKIEKL
jgi:quinol monooxygenase YgiN